MPEKLLLLMKQVCPAARLNGRNAKAGGSVKNLLSTLALAGVLASTNTSAADRRSIDAFHCTDISNDIARLECFDEAYSDFREAANTPGRWLSRTEINPLDDTVTTLVAVNAKETESSLFGAYQLVIRCRGNTLSAWISWRGLVGVNDPLITSRIGSDTAEADRWLESSNHQSTFYPGDTREFVNRLIEADRFVAQIMSGKDKGEIATFNVKGLEKAVKPFEEACHVNQPSVLEMLEKNAQKSGIS